MSEAEILGVRDWRAHAGYAAAERAVLVRGPHGVHAADAGLRRA